MIQPQFMRAQTLRRIREFCIVRGKLFL
jgi:hypothetical protein